MKTREERVAKIIRQFEKLKRDYPEAEVVIEVPGGMLSRVLGETEIFASTCDDIVFSDEWCGKVAL